MTTLRINIDLDRAAFDGSLDDAAAETARILAIVATAIGEWCAAGELADGNGNTVGSWTLASATQPRPIQLSGDEVHLIRHAVGQAYLIRHAVGQAYPLRRLRAARLPRPRRGPPRRRGPGQARLPRPQDEAMTAMTSSGGPPMSALTTTYGHPAAIATAWSPSGSATSPTEARTKSSSM